MQQVTGLTFRLHCDVLLTRSNTPEIGHSKWWTALSEYHRQLLVIERENGMFQLFDVTQQPL